MKIPNWLTSRALVVYLNATLAGINIGVIVITLFLGNYLVVELASVVVFLLVVGTATTRRRLTILDHKIAKAKSERDFAAEMFDKLKKAGPLGGMHVMSPTPKDDERKH